MPVINNPIAVREQYKTQHNLATRRSLHQKYDRNKKWAHWLFENYHFFEGCRILELGCGTGSMWDGQIETLPEGATVELTDFSSGMVEIVRRKFGHVANVTTRVMDIQSIDAADNSYDVVIAYLVLQHVPDLSKAIAEVYRVLKPRGIFYTFTFGRNGAIRFLREKLREFDPHLDAYKESDYPFTMQTARESLKSSFEDVVMYRYADYLEVTDSKDLVEYALSSTAMAGFDRSRAGCLQAFFDSCKDGNGIIYFPREYGMFMAQKNNVEEINMSKTNHPIERLVETLTYMGVEFEVVERPDVLWVGCVDYAVNNIDESDIGATLKRYREELIDVTKQDLINPDWSAALSINYGSHEKPCGIMFAQETYTDKQDERYDLYIQPGGLWLRIKNDKNAASLLGKESADTHEYFSDERKVLRTAAEANGYKQNYDVPVEIEYHCHAEYGNPTHTNYAYIPICRK